MNEKRDEGVSLSPSRPSFREALCLAKKQIRMDCFTPEERRMVNDIAMVIAEIYLMDPEKPIRISGEWLDGHVVAAVFHELTTDHVRQVISDFLKSEAQILNYKAYLRTCLYNAVFTFEAGISHQVRRDLGI